MARSTKKPKSYFFTGLEKIISGGERVTHLYPNDCFYAHLSIYRFARQFCQNGRVLDAGSGAGYGSAYLADHGAQSVWGIDVSVNAIEFSQDNFQRPNLQFQVMDLQNVQGLPSRYFDLVFSSNALEHISGVLPFLRSAWQALKQEGALVAAVPPVINETARAENLAISFHVNIWSPQQWYSVLNLYFSEIQCYRHDGANPDLALNFNNTPKQTVVTEKDYVFAPTSLEQLSSPPTLTALFVARKPRPEEELPPVNSPLTFVDDSFSRSEVEWLRAHLEAANTRIQGLEDHLIDIRNGKVMRLLTSIRWLLKK